MSVTDKLFAIDKNAAGCKQLSISMACRREPLWIDGTINNWVMQGGKTLKVVMPMFCKQAWKKEVFVLNFLFTVLFNLNIRKLTIPDSKNFPNS